MKEALFVVRHFGIGLTIHSTSALVNYGSIKVSRQTISALLKEGKKSGLKKIKLIKHVFVTCICKYTCTHSDPQYELTYQKMCTVT